MTATGDNPVPTGNQIPSKSGALNTFLKRGFSTIILLAVLSGVYLSANAWVYVGIFTLFCGLTSLEWATMLKSANIKSPSWLIIGAGFIYPLLLGISLIMPVCCGGGNSSFYICMGAPAVMAIAAFIRELGKEVSGRETLLSLSGSIISFLYPVWMFGFSLFILFPVPGAGTGEPAGLLLFLWVFLVTKIMDIGAYISGSLFGKHKMIPHISPNKTWEGFAGACVITVLAGYGLMCLWGGGSLSFEPSMIKIMLVSLGLGLVSVVGDLAGSLIKRALGVKDSGKLLPGIGGIYDLIDSPAFTFPLFVLVFLY